MRWWPLLRALWPAVLVWAFIALPSLAWSSYRLQQQELLALPWWLRAMTWAVAHTWPYSKIARAGAVWTRWGDELAARSRESRCRVCGQQAWSPEHLIEHFPGEDEAWLRAVYTPPRFSSTREADEWLARREPGDPSLA